MVVAWLIGRQFLEASTNSRQTLEFVAQPGPLVRVAEGSTGRAVSPGLQWTKSNGLPKQASSAEKVRVDALNLKADLATLVEEAKKNPQLAYALATALLECEYADTAYVGVSEAVGTGMSPGEAQKLVTDLDKIAKKCLGLNGKQFELRFDLAGMAARGDILEAQMNYRLLAGAFVSPPGSIQEAECGRRVQFECKAVHHSGRGVRRYATII